MTTYPSSPFEQLAACLIATNRDKKLEDLLKKHINKENEASLRYYIALSRAKRGEPSEALKEVKLALENNFEHELSRNLAFRLLLHEACNLMREKNWKEISSVLSLALEVLPNDPDAQKEIARFKNALPIAHLKAGRRADAEKIWKEELKKDPTNKILIHSLALLYYWWAVKEEENQKENAAERDSADKFSIGEQSRKKFIVQDEKLSEKAAQKESGKTKKDTDRIGRLWISAISYMILMVNLEGFWQSWKKEREEMWGIDIKEKDIRDLRHSFLDEKLARLFHDYIDFYQQSKRPEDTLRLQEYLMQFLLEKKTARFWREALSLFELSKKDEDVKKFPVDDVLLFPGGYAFLKEFNVLSSAQELSKILHKIEPKNESIGKFRVCIRHEILGKMFIVLEEMRNPDQALQLWEILPEETKISIEGIYVHTLSLLQKGERLKEEGDILKALDDWFSAFKYLSDKNVITAAKESYFDKFFNKLKADLEETVINTCIRETKRLAKEKKTDHAIKILDKGLKVTKDKSLKDHIAALLCDRAIIRTNKKRYSEARKDLKKALSYVPGNKRAKQGLATTYNNEGVASKNVDTSISLLEKACQYDPGSKQVNENLAGMYNGKAVKMLNSLQSSYMYSSYSAKSECEGAMALLKKGIALISPGFNLGFGMDMFMGPLVDKMPEGTLKTMFKNLETAQKIHKQLREY